MLETLWPRDGAHNGECRLFVQRSEPIDGFLNVREILRHWLKANGYDGLGCFDGDPCGCVLDDLISCDECFCPDCSPGYLGPDPSGDCDWLIYLSNEAAEAARKDVTI